MSKDKEKDHKAAPAAEDKTVADGGAADDETVADGATAPPDTDENKSDENKPTEDKPTEDKTDGDNRAFESQVVLVRLRAAHPQESYGRAGYRFNKTEDTRIPYAALSEEQVLALHEDPWLDVAFLED